MNVHVYKLIATIFGRRAVDVVEKTLVDHTAGEKVLASIRRHHIDVVQRDV